MEKRTDFTAGSSGCGKPEIRKAQENVKASHLSSTPIYGYNADKHFEAEVGKAFFRVFFNINL